MESFIKGATFEMRTALYEIHLFNYKLVMHNRFFYIKNYAGESKTVKRQKERERETVHCWK